MFSRNKIKVFRDFARFSDKNRPFSKLAYDSLLNFALEDITDLIDIKNFDRDSRVLEIGGRDGLLTSKILEKFENVWVSEISDIMLAKNPAKHENKVNAFDEDVFQNAIAKNGEYDLVLSFLNFHLIEDVLKFLANVKSILKSGGSFIASFFGQTTLKELRFYLINAELDLDIKSVQRVIPFIRIDEITGILQNLKFRNIVTNISSVEQKYDNVIDLMKFLRSIGESNSMTENRVFSKALYSHIFKDKNEFTTTFDIITIYGEK